jgi:hypothetical protein
MTGGFALSRRSIFVVGTAAAGQPTLYRANLPR